MKFVIELLLDAIVWLYFFRHKTPLIVITGSVGKTSTKFAIVTVLEQQFKVRSHDGNHNTHLSVPPALLGVPYPQNVKSPFAWLGVIGQMLKKVFTKPEIDVIVQELGTDRPGDIKRFGWYLRPNIAVVTAVSPEHMEFFPSMDAVAAEELSVAKFSKFTIVNRDDIDESFAKYAETTKISTYGLSGIAEYHIIIENGEPLKGYQGKFMCPELGAFPVTVSLVGEHNLKAAVVAGAIGAKFGLSSQQIAKGIHELRPVAGRMNVLRGLQNTILLDDTYNASPLAIAAALQTLYKIQTPQRIAILGSMNELGMTSRQAHEQAGQLCDPSLLDWVVTIGEEAGKYLAPAAASRGCQVKSFKNPYDAGGFVHKVMQPGAVILAKGSQNGVFAEEALKVLLHSTTEEQWLVRQSAEWLAIKIEQFSR